MGIVHTSLIDTSIEEVFAWHTRRGAIVRLCPPWQPVRVAEEATSLRDGRAVLQLPGGLRWVAQHDPEGYAPPNHFADRLTSFPLRAALSWHHSHELLADGPGRTRLTDRVETPLPSALLQAMFVYRHRQLADDLAAHERSAREREAQHAAFPQTVAVTGSSGLIGRALTAFLTTGGYRVLHLVRRSPRTPDERTWTPENPASDLLVDVDAVIHLAGAGIAGRFTAAHKQAIYDSRIGPTAKLATVAARGGPRVFVAASAVGYYGATRGDEILTESSPRGDGYLADVVADWEAASAPAHAGGLRVVRVRTGIVQTPQGGTLRLFRPLFALGLGGRLGSGRQWVPWIGIDDLVDVYHRALIDGGLSGPVNAVAPNPVRDDEYARTLARVLRRPALLPIPRIGPHLLLGQEGARELALADQRVRPERLLDAGHHFRHPELDTALRHVLGRSLAEHRD